MPYQKIPDYTPVRINMLENAVENIGILEKSGVSDYYPFGMSMPERSWSLPDACNTYTSLYYDNVLDLDFENENGTWTIPNRNAGVTFSSGNMYLTGYQDGGVAYTDFATETDSSYVITMNFSGVTGLATWNVSARDDQNNVLASTSITSLSTSPLTLEFEAASTTSRLYISRTSGSGTIVLTIEDISIDGKYHKEDVMYLSYRYKFNGKELDPLGMGGGGSTYDYGFRIYNAQIARFLSVDPLTKSFPFYSPYHFAGNNPIWAIDLDGLELTNAQKHTICKKMSIAYLETAKSYGEFMYRERYEKLPFETDEFDDGLMKIGIDFSGIIKYDSRSFYKYFGNSYKWDQKFSTETGKIVKGILTIYVKESKNDMIVTNIYFSKYQESLGVNTPTGYWVRFRNNKYDDVVTILFENQKDIETYRESFRDIAKKTYLDFVKTNQNDSNHKSDEEYINKTDKIPGE